MARKDDIESADVPETTAQEIPVQIISDSEAIHLKLNRILELLSQK